jgi:hypothetical protein
MATLLKINIIGWKIVSQGLILFLMIISCGEGHTIKRRSAPSDVAYFCPMDTLVNSDLPGKCPECKMKLRKNPTYSGSEGDSLVVTTIGDTVRIK